MGSAAAPPLPRRGPADDGAAKAPASPDCFTKARQMGPKRVPWPREVGAVAQTITFDGEHNIGVQAQGDGVTVNVNRPLG